MFKKYISFLFLVFITPFVFSQYKQLSPSAEVSIITAGPGKVLYEGFGHSTIRIKDQDFDTAYNYGIFDFNAPNFYVNFTKGKLLYKLESYPFYYFVNSYQRDQRWVKEQLLNLNQQEKQQFFEYLEHNAKPENATYLYDPYFNNCATILRKITHEILKEKVIFLDNHITKKQSFRQLMNDQIPWNTWGSFGINLALGSKLDNIATPKEFMYLPDFVYSGFKNAQIIRNGIPENLIKEEVDILIFNEIKLTSEIISPLLTFTLILLIVVLITFRDINKKTRTKLLDFLLLFTTGFIGVLVAFLWFFTNHSTTPNNFNILWAFAPNLFISFYLLKDKPKKWVRIYVLLLISFLFFIPVFWISKIQQFPLACISLFIALLIRYLYLNSYLLSSKK